MDAARSVRTRNVLDDRAENDECRTCPECDERIEERKDVRVVDERGDEHRDGRCDSGNRDKSCLDKVLGRLGGTDGADDVADGGEDKDPLEQSRALGPGART